MSERRYAQDTKVTPAKSQHDIETLLARHKVTHFAVVKTPEHVDLEFILDTARHRIRIPLEAKNAVTTKQAQQVVASRWRALLLVLKARLEYAALLNQPPASALAEYRVLPDRRTVAEHVLSDHAPSALSWGES